MARIHGILVLAAIAGGTALWFAAIEGDGVAPPLPPSADQPADTTPAQQPRPDAASGRARVEDPKSEPDAADATKPATPQPIAQSEPADVAPDAPVTLLVRSVTDRRELARFSWRFQAYGGAGAKGDGENGRANLPLPRGVRGQLYVEAEGKQPQALEVETPKAEQPATQVDVFLADAAVLAGVTLQMRDEQQQIVPRARLDLWQLDATTAALPPQEDPAHQPLWKRTGEDVGGALTLPEIPPGDYALRAQPVDAEGWALPLLPQRFRFTFRGGEAVPLTATFAKGIVLAIECAADGGEPMQFDVTTRLASGGDPIPVQWQSKSVDNRTANGRDVALLPGRAQCAIALPIGNYAIEVRRGETLLQLQQTGPTTFRVLALPR